MKFTAIRLARKNLRSHKTRSRVAVIGVVISVFLVSIIFIISDSLKGIVAHELNNINPKSIIVNGAESGDVANIFTNSARSTLTNDDVKQIHKLNRNYLVDGHLILQGTAGFDGTQLANTSIVATTDKSPESLNLEMVSGEWFDDDNDKKWVVLGENIANRLLGTNQVQNQIVDIKGYKFTVVGVIKNTNQPLSMTGYLTDSSIFMSLENGQKIDKSTKLNQIRISNVDKVDEAKQQISTVLGNLHPDNSDYSVNTASSVARKLEQVINYLTIIACVVAGLLLLTSSISVANLMMVNMIERRREIGIRKAVGATTRNIMNQFVMESLIMSLRGGVLGLILAYLFSGVCLLFFAIPLVFSWLALAIGFAIPVLVGILAGIYPAYKASRQDIITALNQLT